MAEETKRENEMSDTEDYEADQNLIGFFELLLKVDKRLHPELYKPITENSDAEL